MAPGEFLDWWIAYQDEPWGDERADFRSAAGVAMATGARGVRPTWPYFETADMLENEFVQLAIEHGMDPEIVRRKFHGSNRSDNPDCA
jgi:hypothetical protein